MPDQDPPRSSIVLYQTEDGRTRIECRFEAGSIWLTQALIAELFQKDVRTINEHLVNIFEEGELTREATIRKFRMVRSARASDFVQRGVDAYHADSNMADGSGIRNLRITRRARVHGLARECVPTTFADGDLAPRPTVRSRRMVRSMGTRQIRCTAAVVDAQQVATSKYSTNAHARCELDRSAPDSKQESVCEGPA
jgi:hypothetical protein